MSRYSVKKPYTVIVAVVLVIILGVVSFTNIDVYKRQLPGWPELTI